MESWISRTRTGFTHLHCQCASASSLAGKRTMNLPNSAGPHRAAKPSEGQAAAQPEAWQSTRAQTQVARDEDTYLAPEQQDIGRLVGDHLRELFVTCDAGPAIQQQFEHLAPEFIAIHDVATHSSRKLIAGIAAASKGAVQKLVIRRQGYGNTLATLEFVELPTAEGSTLRIYSTEADADTTSRHALSRMLLAFSALGVILVGDVPGHSITGIFKPLHENMITGPWPNRNLLLLPLSTANALVTQGMELGRGTGVNVRTTPQVARPADAWNFISGTWGRLRQELRSGAPAAGTAPIGADASSRNAPAAARDTYPSYPSNPSASRPAPGAVQRPAAPLPLRPMPSVPSRSSREAAARDPLTRYVQQLSELTGMVSVCVFEVSS